MDEIRQHFQDVRLEALEDHHWRGDEERTLTVQFK